jgi:hypothetical protein
MGTVAAASNESERIKLRSSVYLVALAASIVPIFLACVSSLSCQQRYYAESHWGGVVVLSSILIYSFGKLPRTTSADIPILQFGSRIESFCYLVCRKLFDLPLFLHDSA